MPALSDPDAVSQDFIDRVHAALDDRYIVEHEIGSGGMAVVFRAHDIRHHRLVAVKVLRPELTALLGPARFQREIRIIAHLQHPHILALYDSGIADGLLYYVMPYVADETLHARIHQHGPLACVDALEITREIADALDYAYRQGIVHRDIKPANVLMSDGHALVADFGIAQALWSATGLPGSGSPGSGLPGSGSPGSGSPGSASGAAGRPLTLPGVAIGTPAYMSPEQAGGAAELDGRSDIYALGCVLYEMLTGTTPFTGTTPQAIITQHLADPPPPLRTVRPDLPRSVETIVATMLAKDPDARFATAGALAHAVEAARIGTPISGVPMARSGTRTLWATRLVVVTAAVLLALWGASHIWRPRYAHLDNNRVVVYPLLSSTGGGSVADGEAVAIYIGFALDGTAPLRWIDGWASLPAPLRSGIAALTGAEARAIAVAQRAAYYIDGAIVRAPDSVRVLLQLHSVAGDSLVARTAASAPTQTASLPQLGVRAVAQLLPAVVEPGRRIDLSALVDRSPTAIAHFLEGEREYRRMHFPAALAYYRRAIGEDSLLTVAALKGAQAASWQDIAGEDSSLIAIALRRPSVLSERQMWIARGLREYMRGSADAAVDAFHRALRIDSTSAEALTALGEVYYHFVPRVATPDSLAEDAFQRARRADPEFTPPLYHLAEIAVRRGDVQEAERDVRTLSAGADSTQFAQQWMMLRCVRDRWTPHDWERVARANARVVVQAAKALAAGGAQPACAGDGFQAVLKTTGGAIGDRWGALLGGAALFAATGQRVRLAQLVASPGARDLPTWSVYLLAAAAGAGFEREADSVAVTQGTAYTTMDATNLWLLGTWEAHRGRAHETVAIAQALAAKADSTHSRRDSLLARIMAAHMSLASGDPNTAVHRFEALVASADRSDIEWQPWESLGLERLTLAEVLAARGDASGAWDVARALEAPAPVAYTLYLRPSLVVQITAATAMGRTDWAATARARLRGLDQIASAAHIVSGSP